MAEVDTGLVARELQSQEQLQKEDAQKRKHKESTQQSNEFHIIIRYCIFETRIIFKNA